MTRENTIAETAQNARKTAAPEPAPRKNRLPLLLGILLLLIIIAGVIVGGLIFFGVIDIDGETPILTATPVDILRPIAEFNECVGLLEARPERYCSTLEIESDSTWSNAQITLQELITDEMAINAIAFPGTQWISPINNQAPIEKVIYLPEGEIEIAAVRIEIGATYPLASITVNGELFIEGQNFSYGVDEIPSALGFIFQRPFPDGNRQVNLRQYLRAGRNLIQFRFADENALPATPEATLDPEATIDPNATPVPPPLYALMAQVRIPVTGLYNSVQRDSYFSDADWQDAPNVGLLPTATDSVLGDAQWIQAVDRPTGADGLVTVERVFYLAETTPNFAITLDIRNATLSSVSFFDGQGNSRVLQLPPSGGTTITEGEMSFQRYEAIPAASGFRVGLNRLVVAYAPNSNVAHFVRLKMTNAEGETVLVSDAEWLRGAYRVPAETSGEQLTLTAQMRRGVSHLRGFVAIPNLQSPRANGNLLITCLQTEREVPCSTIRIRHENQVYNFGHDESPTAISLEEPERLFSLDLSFQSDLPLPDLATVRLAMLFVDQTGATQTVGNGSVWYGYQTVGVLATANSAWAVVVDAAFIESLNDDESGDYISVFETSMTLPENAVVIEAQALGSVDDHVLAIYINDDLAYRPNAASEDFRQVTNFPIDAALLRAGENRIVVYMLNRIGAGALAMRFNVRYFSQRSP